MYGIVSGWCPMEMWSIEHAFYISMVSSQILPPPLSPPPLPKTVFHDQKHKQASRHGCSYILCALKWFISSSLSTSTIIIGLVFTLTYRQQKPTGTLVGELMTGWQNKTNVNHFNGERFNKRCLLFYKLWLTWSRIIKIMTWFLDTGHTIRYAVKV